MEPERDIERKCRDCEARFVIAAGEQRFFASHSLALPARCPECRRMARAQRLALAAQFDDEPH